MNRYTSLIAIALLLAASACSGNGGSEVTNQSNADNEPDICDEIECFCDVEEWECVEFEDGPNLTRHRHGHRAFVLDHERVFLVGGWIRDNDGNNLRVDSCEIVNPMTNEVRVVSSGAREDECFRRIRRDSVIAQLADGSLLAMSGSGADFERLTSAERFDLETERWEWTRDDMPVEYRQSFLTPMLMEDGRLFILRRNERFGSHNFSRPGGVIYDPEEDTWTEVAMPEMDIDTLGGAMLAGDKVLMVLAEVDAMSQEPLIPEDPMDPVLHQGHPLHVYLYDIAEESWERLRTLDTRGVGSQPSLVTLPDSGWILMNIPGDEARPSFGYLFDPASKYIEKRFEREPMPGWVMAVLPGDRVLFHSNDFTQYYDVHGDMWWQFDAYHPGTYFTTLVTLPDCRLFASGERLLSGEDAAPELRGVDTGYCYPVMD